jgi:hypothetical protein
MCNAQAWPADTVMMNGMLHHTAEAFAIDPSKAGLHYELRSPIIHNDCRVEALFSGGVSVSVAESAWAYAATFPLLSSL